MDTAECAHCLVGESGKQTEQFIMIWEQTREGAKGVDIFLW